MLHENGEKNMQERFAQSKSLPYICTAFERNAGYKKGSLGEWLKPPVC